MTCLLITHKHFMLLLLILTVASYIGIIFLLYSKWAKSLKWSDLPEIIKLNKSKMDLNPVFYSAYYVKYCFCYICGLFRVSECPFVLMLSIWWTSLFCIPLQGLLSLFCQGWWPNSVTYQFWDCEHL